MQARFVILAVSAASAALPLLAQAETPTAYLERSQTQASGHEIRNFQVPVTDPTGKVNYFDVTTTLTVQADGTLASTATVDAVPSAKLVRSNLFVSGTYRDTYGNTCKINPAYLPSGRQETAVNCSGGNTFVATWDNGDLKGSPFSNQLLAAGINKLNWQGYAWGVVQQAGGNLFDYCFSTNDIVAARMEGSSIVITDYGTSNFNRCGIELTPA